MNQILYIISTDIAKHIPYVTTLFTIWIGLFLISFIPSYVIHTPYGKSDLRFFRRYLLFVMGLSLVSVIYWSIDVHIANLPDPIALYFLFILLITARYGLKVGIITSLISLALNIFTITNLYADEFKVHTIPNHLMLLTALISFGISIYVGNWIKRINKDRMDMEKLIQARDELQSITAHELKNPVAAIKLYAQVLARNHQQVNIESTLSESMQKINRETDKLTLMIDNLMDYSKLKGKKIVYNRESVDLNQIVSDKVHLMRSLNPTHSFRLNLKTSNAPIYVDSLALDRVITNLLTNAVKYSAPGTLITISVTEDREHYCLSVQDEGIGMKPEQINQVFAPFYQTDSGHKGLGLGLYICKNLVEANHGKIWVESQFGVGSVFHITWPKAPTS